MSTIKIRTGNEADLPSNADDAELLLTNDTNKLYRGNSSGAPVPVHAYGTWSAPPNGYSFDGVNGLLTVGDIGFGNTFELHCTVNTTTEQLLDLNGTASISISSGVITATGFTSPTIYINGIVSSTITANTLNHIIITTDTAIDCTAINIGKISTNYGAFKLYSFRITNQAYTADQVSLLFNNGRPWESRLGNEYFTEGAGAVYESDFSADTDGYFGLNLTLTANVDGVSDGTTTKDDCASLVPDTSTTYHFINTADSRHNIGGFKYYRVSCEYLIKDTNAIALGLRLVADNIDTTIVQDFTVGEWSKMSGVIKRDGIVSYLKAVALTAGGSRNFTGNGTDIIYIKNIEIEALGETFSLRPEGMGKYTAKDMSGNKNHATVSGASAIARVQNPIAEYKAMTGDTTLTSAGTIDYVAPRFVIENTTANAVVISAGTSAAGTQIFSSKTIAANSFTVIATDFYFDAESSIYIHSADWNSSSINVIMQLDKVQ